MALRLATRSFWIARPTALLVVGLLFGIGMPDPVALVLALRVPAAEGLSGSPAGVAARFAAMPASSARALAVREPAAIGNLDGAPAALRYLANGLAAAGDHGRQLLGYQPGGHGRIIEVIGDLGVARRIAVLVPGVGTTVANFETGHGGVQRRAPGWWARQLAAAAGPDIAVIAWLGYDAPEGLDRAAVRSERAEAGADALVRFVAGVVAQRPRATLALIGDSYGTVVLGHAASRLPAGVTDLVALASPGMDVSRAADLHAHARVWAGSAPDDWTLRLPDLRILGAGHGTNPTRAGYGALRLDVHDARGHDGYFVPGTTALASIAAVANGSAVGASGTR